VNDPLDELQKLADAGELEALERAVDALWEEADEDERIDLSRYRTWARFESGDFEGALAAARRADDHLFEAKAHFHLWRFDKARHALDRFDRQEPDMVTDEDLAESCWYRALLAEFSGEDPAPFYGDAEALAPGLFPQPVRLDDAQVDEVVEQALAALPPDIASEIENTVVAVQDLPRPEPDVDPLVLGLYVGSNLLERSIEDSAQLPARIEVYRKNIERVAEDHDEAVDELRITLLHEIGHHAGYDEDELERLGLG
jgi:predicted Zn-dependent protease with MMP-like domain